jgi:hypothetical protein
MAADAGSLQLGREIRGSVAAPASAGVGNRPRAFSLPLFCPTPPPKKRLRRAAVPCFEICTDLRQWRIPGLAPGRQLAAPDRAGHAEAEAFPWIPSETLPEEKMTSNQKCSILAMIICLCLIPAWAMAGADPAVVRAPAPVHHFLDAKNIALFSVNAIVMGADIATTERALAVPGAREANPLMRSQAAIIPLKVASVGAGLGLAYMLHRSGHHKAERIIPLFLAAPSALAAVHNAGIHQ